VSLGALEKPELRVLAAYLDMLGVTWLHVPNEGQHRLARYGVKGGAPDVLIFTPPPAMQRLGPTCGAAIELKRPDGKGRTSPTQREWLRRLGVLGWSTAVCAGAGEAIQQLTRWGYRAGMRHVS
jgi:hypothetical protein